MNILKAIDLMEELGRTSRLARRLALAGMICCSASTGYTVDPPASEATQPQTFRSLLAEGWSSKESAGPASSPAAKLQIATSEEAESLASSKPVAAESDEKPSIVRPSLRTLEVPFSVLATKEQPELLVESSKVVDSKPELSGQEQGTTHLRAFVPTNEQPATRAPVPTSLAELIHRHTEPLQVPESTNDSDAIQDDFVPSVNRLDVEQRVAANAVRQQDQSAANLKVAKPIKAQPQIAKPPIAEAAIGDAERLASPIAKVEPRKRKSEQLTSEAPATSVLANSLPIEAPICEVQTPRSPMPGDLIDFPSPLLESDMFATTPSERSRRAAKDSGFGLLPLDSFESNAAVELGSERDEASLTVTIHATRLRELARESLRNSSHRMQRQATHSAKKYALEALRSIVAMLDAEAGGNQHAKQLDVALDAIRESDDFCGRFGVVDPNAMQRMVAVHETNVLKGRDLENVSSLEATETYLAVAKKNLTAAAGGVREASEALVLLGKIEKQMSKPGDTHAAAVAVTLQRAAVEVSPTNGPGYRELGTTLLEQGLDQQAATALSRSIEIQPTRSGYQGLLDASRRLGDVDTARLCLRSLQNPSNSDETPVKTLSPEAFAATYKPNLNELKTVKPQPTVSDPPKTGPTKIGLRTLFPFSRR